MKQDIFEQFKILAKSDIADPAWVQATRKKLMAYVSLHSKTKSRLTWFRYAFHMTPAILAVIVIFATTGVSLAAQSTIPGDALYPWKIAVESIESVLIVGVQERAKFEVVRTTKRLQEVAELSVRKESDQKIVAEAKDRLEIQVKVATEKIAEAAVEDKTKALETAVALGSALQAHEQVLQTAETKVDEGIKSQVHDTVSTIQKTSENVKGTIADLKISEEDAEKQATEKQFADAQIKINTVWDIVVKIPEGTDLRLDAEAQLKFAQDALDSAQISIDTEEYSDATIEIQLAQKLASDVTAVLEATEGSGDTLKQILAPSPTPLASPSVSPSPSPSVSVSPSQTQTTSPTITPTASPSANLDVVL